MEQQLDYAAVRAAAGRIAGAIRPAAVVPAAEGVWYALEYLQHTGSFKARGARNFLAAHHRAGTLPEAGVTIASGGNAGLACAWAARAQGVPATVFLPANAPRVKVERLRGYGAEVRLVGDRYADALAACEEFAAASGALASHAYDHPLIAAGAGTLLDEIRAALPGLDTVVVAVGGGGLFAGIATAAREHGVRVVAAEPENSRALNAALEAGRVVDVAVDSVAGDSLGATRVSADALAAARYEGVRSVLVPDQAITAARRALWEEHRIVVEAGAATALAALRTAPQPLGGRVAVVLCGANTDPGDLTAPGI
ncbi:MULTISPECIES: serine/threonine dehydratase [Streptomyces]|uniref:serine/threonine dehydratase n=1 Tax=Streptomyces TaxID=1883 RepID=UPI00017E8995|nr:MULTISPECIES: serine/threonine dehydratase [Streptomyces]AKL65124.1 threonine dehydratase [Streptomyces sp. Mg1]EDX26399.1 threonine dehydratase [Streptomyces sp. Mg1]WBY19080.1 serine/threonine dehydratase [Streptomyces goshikiensis]WSR97861.1 serine/threonine dehydratase [Streptomyces goshikiensis]WSY01100.1 serine/threonine dehydratase [Streptomyces goshikiensis]